MTVCHELDPQLELPLVPIMQNCAVYPMMPLRGCYEFGVGDIDEEFDHWFLDIPERGDVRSILDLPDDELELAGNGAHEIRSWLTIAGAVAPATGRTLAYEPIHPWITGMGVSRFQLTL
jgi:hypothetical protein